jgi:hypothetical protein
MCGIDRLTEKGEEPILSKDRRLTLVSEHERSNALLAFFVIAE